jgi:hypothetical protein
MITIEYWKDDHRFTYSHDDYEPDRVEFSSLSRHDINEPTFIKHQLLVFYFMGFLIMSIMDGLHIDLTKNLYL